VQQRLVHSQNFEFPEVRSTVEELSVDGGKIRIRTPIGKPCDWKGYKAVRLHNLQAIAASFQENNLVIDWVNNQPLASTLTCLGDGHDGIWKIIREFTPEAERREILDWFHLMENLFEEGRRQAAEGSYVQVRRGFDKNTDLGAMRFCEIIIKAAGEQGAGSRGNGKRTN
jgi:hypothetical protein